MAHVCGDSTNDNMGFKLTGIKVNVGPTCAIHVVFMHTKFTVVNSVCRSYSRTVVLNLIVDLQLHDVNYKNCIYITI